MPWRTSSFVRFVVRYQILESMYKICSKSEMDLSFKELLRDYFFLVKLCCLFVNPNIKTSEDQTSAINSTKKGKYQFICSDIISRSFFLLHNWVKCMIGPWLLLLWQTASNRQAQVIWGLICNLSKTLWWVQILHNVETCCHMKAIQSCFVVFRRSGLTRDGGSMTTMGGFIIIIAFILIRQFSGHGLFQFHQMPAACDHRSKCSDANGFIGLYWMWRNGKIIDMFASILTSLKGRGHRGDSSSCIWGSDHRPLGPEANQSCGRFLSFSWCHINTLRCTIWKSKKKWS